MATQTAPVWQKGKPPHIGWWQASTKKDPITWRWWNGSCWSKDAKDSRSASFAADRAKIASRYNVSSIWWTNFWPTNARVPRVAPK